MTGVVLAGMAGCSSQAAVPRGSLASCFQFGVTEIRLRVTATALPAACQGLSQLQVNVALDRAQQAVAGRARGKVRQREIIGSDRRYLAALLRAGAASSEPAGSPYTAPGSPPSRAPLSLAALAAWLVTVGLGVSMMARWITRRPRPGQQRGHAHGPVLNFVHFGLAITGLLVWISFVVTSATGLAWAACGLLLPVAALGMTLVFLGPDRRAITSPTTTPLGRTDPDRAATVAVRPGGDTTPARHLPVLVIAAHVVAACITILLAVLAAIGPG